LVIISGGKESKKQKQKEKPSVRKLMFFSSIRTKFALTHFAVVAIVLVLINTYFLLESRDIVFATKRLSVQSQAELIATHLEETFDSLTHEDEERITAVVTQLDIAGSSHIVITDDEGMVLYDPSGRSTSVNFPIDHIKTALEGNDIFYSRFRDATFSSSAFRPIMSRGVAIGVVYYHEDDADQGTLLIEMQNTIQNISIVVVVISIVIVTLIVLSVMRRVKSITNAVKSVREGEYSYMINMKGSDELGLLSDEFNSLTGRLRETDEVRRRFVADASHELKTPLATIKLLTDSILQNEDIDNDTLHEFLKDIGMEADRLSRTTDRLMTLTRLDSHIEDELIKVDMKEAVSETLRMLRPLADSMGIKVKGQLAEGCFIRTTEDAVNHIVFNLVENAIKYNQPNGSVFVRLYVINDKVVLDIMDRGVGVPDEDLPHIFDRFYRVDKARSRDAGGSGLGLAIVKDTVTDLGASVGAKPRKSGGMIFSVSFDLYK
jgi:signal transduction histidine kinase